jgi:hypothetical protein
VVALELLDEVARVSEAGLPGDDLDRQIRLPERYTRYRATAGAR